MKVGDLVKVNFYGFDQLFHGILLAFHPYYKNGRNAQERGDWTILFNDGDIDTFRSAAFGCDGEMTVEVISEGR